LEKEAGNYWYDELVEISPRVSGKNEWRAGEVRPIFIS